MDRAPSANLSQKKELLVSVDCAKVVYYFCTMMLARDNADTCLMGGGDVVSVG